MLLFRSQVLAAADTLSGLYIDSRTLRLFDDSSIVSLANVARTHRVHATVRAKQVHETQVFNPDSQQRWDIHVDTSTTSPN